jgi:hypothetical protein
MESVSPVFVAKNLSVNAVNSCETLKLFFLIVKKILMYCRMDFKPRVHMALSGIQSSSYLRFFLISF